MASKINRSPSGTGSEVDFTVRRACATARPLADRGDCGRDERERDDNWERERFPPESGAEAPMHAREGPREGGRSSDGGLRDTARGEA